MRRDSGSTGVGHALAFAAAAGAALALALAAHGLLLTLAAVLIGPLPAAQTALSLNRSRPSAEAPAPAEPESAVPEEPAAASDAPQAPAAVELTDYLVTLEPDEARPADAGTVIEKTYPQGSGEKYIACSRRQNGSVSTVSSAVSASATHTNRQIALPTTLPASSGFPSPIF